MVEQFSSFVQEALEFLSLLRASEKERFDAEKKFMTETTKILKELADSIKKNNELIKNNLDELKKNISIEIKKIEEKIGLDTLTSAIDTLENSVDMLQRGSTILDYKFTVQKTREILDSLQKNVSKVEITPTPPKNPPAPQPAVPIKKTADSPPQPTVPKKKSPSPPTPKEKLPIATPVPSPQDAPKKGQGSDDDYKPSFEKYDPVAAAMGTRSTSHKEPRRVVKLKKAPTTKIIDRDGETIEIDTSPDEDD